jgi:hypothetical protein
VSAGKVIAIDSLGTLGAFVTAQELVPGGPGATLVGHLHDCKLHWVVRTSGAGYLVSSQGDQRATRFTVPLERAVGDDGFEMPLPPNGRKVPVSSPVSGFARLVRHRCNEVGVFGDGASSPLRAALMDEPKAGPDGTLSWTVDVVNPSTNDDFALFSKEGVTPDGRRRPYSMWLAGNYPRVLDGLCKLLTMDMRIVVCAGTVSARVRDNGEASDGGSRGSARQCPECHSMTLVRQDGCDKCSSCGHVGSCG